MPQVATFDTVEDFWALMNYISEANNLPVGSDYSLFKVRQNIDKSYIFTQSKKCTNSNPFAVLQKGIFPDWEDVRNAQGGRWMVSIHN